MERERGRREEMEWEKGGRREKDIARKERDKEEKEKNFRTDEMIGDRYMHKI